MHDKDLFCCTRLWQRASIEAGRHLHRPQHHVDDQLLGRVEIVVAQLVLVQHQRQAADGRCGDIEAESGRFRLARYCAVVGNFGL